MSVTWEQLGSIVFVVGIVVLLIKLVSNRFSARHISADGRPLKTAPCLPWLPVVGSLPYLGKAENMAARFTEESKRLGSVFGFYVGGRYAVVLNSWSTIREAFVKRAIHYADRKPFLGEKTQVNPHLKGIGSSPYSEDFAKHRQLSLSILKDLGYGRSLVESRINVELDRLVESVSKFNGSPFDPRDLLYRFVNGIITGFMFGCNFDYDIKPMKLQINALIESALPAFAPEIDLFPVVRFLPRYAKVLRAYVDANRDVMELFEDNIKQCIESDDECFVKSYVTALGPDCDMEQLKFTLRDLILAGSETTMSTTRWALVFLANRPDWQKRVQDQIDDVLGDRRLTLTDMSKLPRVEASILEVMRIETLAPLGVPRSTLCDTEVDGFFIPKNTMVMPNIYGVHMDPSLWSAPSEFQPERFLNPNEQIINKDYVIPFSVGKRSCLGELLARQELFFTMTRLLQLFDIRPPEGQQVITVTEEVSVAVRPSCYKVRLIPRAGI